MLFGCRRRAGGSDVAKKTGRYDIEGLRHLVERAPGCPEFPALAEVHRRQGRAEEARRVSQRGLEEAPERMAGRVSLGLALIDLGAESEAKSELAGILDALLEPHRLGDDALVEASADLAGDAPLAPFAPLAPLGRELPGHAPGERPGASDLAALPLQNSEQPSGFAADVAPEEIEQAFEHARSEPDEMLSANRMAEEVLLEHVPADEQEDLADAFDVESAEPYRTQTMASLLERQGDHSGAQAIRETLDGPAPGGDDLALATEATLQAGAAGEAEAAPRTRRSQILSTLESWLNNLQGGAA